MLIKTHLSTHKLFKPTKTRQLHKGDRFGVLSERSSIGRKPIGKGFTKYDPDWLYPAPADLSPDIHIVWTLVAFQQLPHYEKVVLAPKFCEQLNPIEILPNQIKIVVTCEHFI